MPQFYMNKLQKCKKFQLGSFIKDKMQLKKEKEDEALDCVYVV